METPTLRPNKNELENRVLKHTRVSQKLAKYNMLRNAIACFVTRVTA